MELIPVSAWLAEALFRATDVVPTNKLLLPSTADGIVPERLPAISEVRDAPDAQPLKVSGGEIVLENVCFGYDTDREILMLVMPVMLNN